jgi:hypothetical protein
MQSTPHTITVSDIIAIWGGITGTAGLVVSILTYFRDRANIKLSIMKNGIMSDHTALLHGYQPKTTYTTIKVSNRGRRPVKIDTVAFVYLKKDGSAILGDSMRGGRREIAEGDSTSYLTPADDLDFNEISYFAAYDAVGNAYKIYVTPFYKRLLWWLLFFTHIKRKENITPGVRKRG